MRLICRRGRRLSAVGERERESCEQKCDNPFVVVDRRKALIPRKPSVVVVHVVVARTCERVPMSPQESCDGGRDVELARSFHFPSTAATAAASANV